MKKQLSLAAIGLVAIVSVILVIFFSHGDDLGQSDGSYTETYTEKDNKKVLVWLMDEIALTDMTEEKMEAFNRKLKEKGADFELRWVAIPFQGDYHANLKAYIESGEQADLLYTGNLLISGSPGAVTDSYMLAWQNNWLLPLQDIMPEALWNAFDQGYWDSLRIDGEIYGLSTDPLYGRSSVLLVQEGLDLPVNNITTDLKSILPIIKELPDEYPLELPNTLRRICSYLGYTPIDAGMAMDSSGRAFNLFEDEAFVSYIKTAREFVEKGYIDPNTKADFFTAPVIVEGNEAIEIFPVPGYQGYGIGELSIETVKAAVGISKLTTYPNEALTLLSWLVTDQELADLMVFGVEGTDYQYSYGIITGKINPLLRWYTGLYAFTTPALTDIPDKMQKIREYNCSAVRMPITGFHFNSSGWEDTIFHLNGIIQDYVSPKVVETSPGGGETTYRAIRGVLTGHSANPEEILDSLNAELKAANVDDLVAQVNKQFAEWHAAHGKAAR